jgi:DNA-binding LacI/PurR family transcriptional regulator
VPSQRPSTARARLVHAVTEEILNKNEQASFPIASEHQLCRQFNVSRVTVRLALSDLENRGLIYRRHGKGTFAYGRSTRIHRYLGILMKSPHSIRHRPLVEMIQGAQKVMTELRSAILIINTPPAEWRPEKASSLGGVIVIPQDVTQHDLDVLGHRNLPYIMATQSALPGPVFELGMRSAARKVTEDLLQLGHRRFALMTGYDDCLDTPKRLGVHEALQAAGIDPAQVPELSIDLDESKIFDVSKAILDLNPRPTAVLTFDDSFGTMVRYFARREKGLEIPRDLSIASFHDWPYLNHIEPALSSVAFEFFQAGQRAAEALTHSALTGQPVGSICFEPTFTQGESIGPAPGV